MSQALGAAVRVQYMRAEGTGWDPKGPASIHRARACLDTSGKVVGYRIDSRGFSRTDIATTESDHAHSLAGQLMGMKPSPTQEFGIPTALTPPASACAVLHSPLNGSRRRSGSRHNGHAETSRIFIADSATSPPSAPGGRRLSHAAGQILGWKVAPPWSAPVAHHSVPADPHQPRRTTCRSDRPAACWNVSNE